MKMGETRQNSADERATLQVRYYTVQFFFNFFIFTIFYNICGNLVISRPKINIYMIKCIKMCLELTETVVPLPLHLRK